MSDLLLGATQISGTGFIAGTGECTSPPPGALFALTMTGDLEGCLYVFVDEFECSPSGTYREQGRELFVSAHNAGADSFWTTYKFEAKYSGLAADCDILKATEIFGRCQHPIVKGSGTGVFEGVTGRLDFKDDIAAGNSFTQRRRDFAKKDLGLVKLFISWPLEDSAYSLRLCVSSFSWLRAKAPFGLIRYV